MGNELVSSAVTVCLGLIGVATIAVLVSKQADTGNVISQAAKGFATDLSAAVSPVTGGGFTGGGSVTF